MVVADVADLVDVDGIEVRLPPPPPRGRSSSVGFFARCTPLATPHDLTEGDARTTVFCGVKTRNEARTMNAAALMVIVVGAMAMVLVCFEWRSESVGGKNGATRTDGAHLRRTDEERPQISYTWRLVRQNTLCQEWSICNSSIRWPYHIMISMAHL